jgi:hypothetical protein
MTAKPYSAERIAQIEKESLPLKKRLQKAEIIIATQHITFSEWFR